MVCIYSTQQNEIIPLTRTCRTANNWLSATVLHQCIVSNSGLIACGCKQVLFPSKVASPCNNFITPCGWNKGS